MDTLNAIKANFTYRDIMYFCRSHKGFCGEGCNVNNCAVFKVCNSYKHLFKSELPANGLKEGLGISEYDRLSLDQLKF